MDDGVDGFAILGLAANLLLPTHISSLTSLTSLHNSSPAKLGKMHHFDWSTGVHHLRARFTSMCLCLQSHLVKSAIHIHWDGDWCARCFQFGKVQLGKHATPTPPLQEKKCEHQIDWLYTYHWRAPKGHCLVHFRWLSATTVLQQQPFSAEVAGFGKCRKKCETLEATHKRIRLSVWRDICHGN